MLNAGGLMPRRPKTSSMKKKAFQHEEEGTSSTAQKDMQL
jgi:hypothetical protein